MVRQFVLLIFILAISVGCGSKPEAKGAARHYPVTGRVMGLDAKNQTVSLDAAAIPGYMEAMRMDYPVPSRKDFDSLHVGDKVQATVNVYDSGDYDLSSVQKQTSDK
ncbi:MAG TPA: copper-binding protein [Chthoniobacterales bacterium]|nr:copper-binding protein [Chthoniobacterales bacterium]